MLRSRFNFFQNPTISLYYLYVKGDQISDWLFVENDAQMLYSVMTQGKPGETDNIGGRNEKQNLEVNQCICNLIDESVPKEGCYRVQIPM